MQMCLNGTVFENRSSTVNQYICER